MRRHFCIPVLAIVILGLAACMGAQEAKTAASDAEIAEALDNAMEPAEAHDRLDFMVGEFDVRIRTWLDPAQPPIESTAAAVHTWVLGHRYVQTMLSGYVMGEPFDGIGYAGFNNVSKQYEATFMDTGGTGMEWFSGTMDPGGRSAKLTATIEDPITGKPATVEMRLRIADNGDHLTELWETDQTGNIVKIMELQYTRQES